VFSRNHAVLHGIFSLNLQIDMDGHKYSDCYLAPIAQTSVVANTTCMMKTGDYVDLVQARSVISILYHFWGCNELHI
jgi:hypothetical protein